MAEGKAKNNSSDSLAPPQLRSLRTRKKKCPSDETYETGDVQAPLPHQEPTMTSAQQHQTAEQSCLTEQDPGTEEKHDETTFVSLKNVMLKVEVQEETTVTIPNKDSQLGLKAHTDNEANQNGSGKEKEEITAKEFNRSTPQTCTDQLQILSPASEEDDGSSASALEVQQGAKENCHCNLERNQETSQEEHSNVYNADVKEVTKEAEAGLPAKKKRRMGMCGLTEKERSHFLRTQKRENGQNRLKKAEEQICNNTADLVVQEEIISSLSLPSSLSIPAAGVTEQAGIKLQSSHRGRDERAETEVHVAVTTSDGTSAVCVPGCSKVKSCEAEGSTVPGPEQTSDKKSDSSAEEELSRNQEQQEPEECKADNMAEKLQEQMKDGGDGFTAEDKSPAVRFDSNPMQNEESENWDAIEAAHLQVDSVTRTRDEKKKEVTCDGGDGDQAEAGASSTDTRSGRFNCGSVELSEAAMPPGGAERKGSCDPDDKLVAGPSTQIAVDPQTGDTTDLFGSGYLDYVSDSQLNTITLIEEEVMETEDGSPDCRDATDLICGLIRELSSLNRKVMAFHRELENLRRHKSSRSSTR